MIVSDLLIKLRTCSPKERQSVAMQLAKMGTEEAINELIKMVEGKRKSFLSKYDFDDQLIGIECLGETKSKQALAFLKWISINQVRNSYPKYEEHGPPYDRQTEQVGRVDDIDFPNSSGMLRVKLAYSLQVDYDYEKVTGYIVTSGKQFKKEVNKDQKVHSVLNLAINKLEKTLRNE